ncbi:helix-turn-helix protein [Micromonospora sp. Llam0]|uniref:Scr1 family TA system antitoxin-like transcriptional regulator n=1 Tax=Micromonospora sp. Llam0 TaxID=2485143 RepID=UPI000FBB8C1F|nr:Scr1 family TA system antitoxin-like transcriptional regulator [Micromonospora sp. Llam0]ROO58758.1 helix-turn-helix protein [Micromonospora sp. Llam0]
MNTLPEILRQLRSERSVTQDQVGEAILVSGSLIAAFEQGRLVPQPDTAARLDQFFGSGDRVRKAAAEAAEARELERERRRMAQAVWFRPWVQLEESATALRYYEASLIPGLLQTEEYARSVLDSGLRSQREVDEQLAVRMERQSVVLGREDPAICVFMMDVAALRSAHPAMAKAQLERLLADSERHRTFVHVVPDGVGMHIGRSVSFVLASLDNGALAGYMEDIFEGRLVTAPARVTGLDRAWHTVNALALNAAQSRDLIRQQLREL